MNVKQVSVDGWRLKMRCHKWFQSNYWILPKNIWAIFNFAIIRVSGKCNGNKIIAMNIEAVSKIHGKFAPWETTPTAMAYNTMKRNCAMRWEYFAGDCFGTESDFRWNSPYGLHVYLYCKYILHSMGRGLPLLFCNFIIHYTSTEWHIDKLIRIPYDETSRQIEHHLHRIPEKNQLYK